jgi:hypothetical protein
MSRASLIVSHEIQTMFHFIWVVLWYKQFMYDVPGGGEVRGDTVIDVLHGLSRFTYFRWHRGTSLFKGELSLANLSLAS